MRATELKTSITNGDFNKTFEGLYPDCNSAIERYNGLVDLFAEKYGDGDLRLFSTPGRTEVGGNHTDHQHGCVLAASVDLDVIAVAKKTDDNIIKLQSAGFDREDVIDLSVLEPIEEEVEHSPSLIRGVAARFKQLGYNIGGFCAYTTSNVLKGSGLSSSAAFEVLICTIMNSLYNDDKMNSVEKALVSQYAENVFFKKPCGLMDQMACSTGGFVGIDFKKPGEPVVERVDFDFKAVNHSLCIVDTGGNHADLTSDYAAVPAEMKAVAALCKKEVLRDVDVADFYKSISSMRGKVSDRAVLRAIHFFDDNARAVKLKEALKNNDFEKFLQIIKESGRSSATNLQNIFAACNPHEQGLSLALALTEKILCGRGAFRVHGGGFAGTIQAFVPNDLLSAYKQEIEQVFGKDKCYVLTIRPVGGIEIIA